MGAVATGGAPKYQAFQNVQGLFGLGGRCPRKWVIWLSWSFWDGKQSGRECEISRGNIGCVICCGLVLFISGPKKKKIPSILPRAGPMGVLRARQENRLYGGKNAQRNLIKPVKFIYINIYVYICALCPPFVPFLLERDNNSVPGTSCQF